MDVERHNHVLELYVEIKDISNVSIFAKLLSDEKLCSEIFVEYEYNIYETQCKKSLCVLFVTP